jgi:hypothetical protein
MGARQAVLSRPTVRVGPRLGDALRLSGTVTVLLVGGLARPRDLRAQASGTMQVSATVVRGAPAWGGLEGVREVVGLAASGRAGLRPTRVERALSQVELVGPMPADAARAVVVSVQYLRN